jgi:hypothetical protein
VATHSAVWVDIHLSQCVRPAAAAALTVVATQAHALDEFHALANHRSLDSSPTYVPVLPCVLLVLHARKPGKPGKRSKALVEETMLRILLLGAVLQVSRAARNSVISNIEPRRDTKGAIIDAHDGNVVRDPRT